MPSPLIDYLTRKPFALPGGEVNGAQLVRSLEGLEAESCRGIMSLNKDYPRFCARVIRLAALKASLDKARSELAALERQSRALPSEARVWDNSGHTKQIIESDVLRVRKDSAALSKEYEQLSRQIAGAEADYKSRRKAGDAQGTLIERYKGFSARVSEVEDRLKRYTKAVHYLKEQINFGNEQVMKGFSEEELLSSIKMLRRCEELDRAMKKDLHQPGRAVTEHSISKRIGFTVGNYRRALIYSRN